MPRSRTSFRSPLLDPKSPSLSMASKCGDARTGGASSTVRSLLLYRRLRVLTSLRSREREPLRVRVLAKLPHPHPSAGPHRDNFADPLRDIPCQAIACSQGVQRCRRRQQPAHLSCGRERTQQGLAAEDDNERILVENE